jgi:putative transposase
METSNKQRRKNSLRLTGWNYSDYGHYFITLCVRNKIEKLGNIKNGLLFLNKYGKIANLFWKNIPDYYKNVYLDGHIIMPNHIHGIIHIDAAPCVRAEYYSALTDTADRIFKGAAKKSTIGLLSKIIRSFKCACISYFKKNFNDFDFQWQRSYYDHIIRDENALARIQRYIINNPIKWQSDRNKRYRQFSKSTHL